MFNCLTTSLVTGREAYRQHAKTDVDIFVTGLGGTARVSFRVLPGASAAEQLIWLGQYQSQC